MVPATERPTPLDRPSLRVQAALSALASPLYAAFVAASLRLRFGLSFERDEREFDAVEAELRAHRGPLIVAANHLTGLDPWMLMSSFGLRRIFALWKRDWFPPWVVSEYRLYYFRGGWLRSRLVRLLLYLGRSLPNLGLDEDEEALERRREVHERCSEALRSGGAVVVFPEYRRSRRGWLERRRPKDFVGQLALAAPGAAFLCVYQRGLGQRTYSDLPRRNERVVTRVAFMKPDIGPASTAREVSTQVFDRLADLQEAWFDATGERRRCAGVDVVDLKEPSRHNRFDGGRWDARWLEAHLTKAEQTAVEAAGRDAFLHFWSLLCAKEAAAKAFRQAGLETDSPVELEADLFRRRVLHLPTGAEAPIRLGGDDEQVHCVAVFRGGEPGDELEAGDAHVAVAPVPPGADASAAARTLLLRLLASESDEIAAESELTVGEDGPAPVVYWRGRPQDWGVSLSHSGRFAAACFVAGP